jgi:hypothetical protein
LRDFTRERHIPSDSRNRHLGNRVAVRHRGNVDLAVVTA